MRATVLTSVLVAFLSIVNVSASEPKTKIYNNIETTENGCVKEYTFINLETLSPEKKSVYEYNADGLLVTKTEYKWNSEGGWTGFQKYEYEYNKNNKLTYLTHTEWDNERNTWCESSKQFAHLYDTNGQLLTIEEIQTVNENYMAQQ